MNVVSLSSRRQWLVVMAWIVLIVAALPLASKVNEKLDATARLEGSESARVATALREGFQSPFADLALLRVSGAPSPRTLEGRSLLEQVIATLNSTPGVAGVLTYLENEDPAFIGNDGSSIVIVGLDVQQSSGDALIANLRAATEALRLRLAYSAIAFRWTGEGAVNADIRRASSEETHSAELRVLPITLLLLLIAFRSPVAAVLPLLCGALTMLVALGLAVAVNRFSPVSVILVSVVSMVGLGLSIDYALLIVSRYREALDEGSTRRTACIQAGERGGRTVIVSGAAVAIGFAAMLLVRVNEVRSIGIGGLLVTIVSVLVATTLLPLVLVWIGPWIDATQLAGSREQQAGRYWRRWADCIGRHPVWVLVLVGLPLTLLAVQATRLRIDLPRGRWLPANAESVSVLNELESVGRSNFGQTIRIIVNLPTGVTVTAPSGWDAVSRLAASYAKDPRVDHLWAVATLSGARLGGPAIVERLADVDRRSLVSLDGRATLVELLPREGLSPADVTGLVREIRSTNPKALTGLSGTQLLVGGVPAFNADYQDVIASTMMRVVVSVVCATFLVLAVAFRSVLIPVKAIALNLLSVAAAFGAVVIVFQDGFGSGLLGLAHPLNGGFPILPVLVFCAVFGLSMDYEVFLVARVAEGHRAGLADGAALAEGLANTGRVITLAAAIMVAIFGGFVLGDFVLIKILGFALGVAVLIDATLVRLALGPALIRLAGRWNWWPGEPLNDHSTRSRHSHRGPAA